MIVEEDDLKKRLLKSIESCVKELRVLYDELQMAPFEVWSLKHVGPHLSTFSREARRLSVQILTKQTLNWSLIPGSHTFRTHSKVNKYH